MGIVSDTLISQKRVIFALIMRETKTLYGSSRLGFLLEIIEPFLTIGVLWLAWAAMGRERGIAFGMSLPVFLLCGHAPWWVFAHTSIRCMVSVRGNSSLLAYPQVKTLDLYVARTVLTAAALVVSCGAMLGLLELLGFATTWDAPVRIMVGMALSSCLGMSYGMVVAAASVFFHSVDSINKGFLLALYFSSGIFYSSNMLPVVVREVILYNPMLHAVELTRSGFSNTYHYSYTSALYPTVWAVGLLLFGLILDRAVNRRIEML